MANFLFVRRGNNFEQATRCFQFAKIAHAKGHRVNLFSSTAVLTGRCTIGTAAGPCAKNRQLDEARFHSNMVLDSGPHLIDMAAEAKVFNF